jgi:repressor LexA
MAQPRSTRDARELGILRRLHAARDGHKPSLDELAAGVGAAKSTVHLDLQRLEAAGQVRATAPPGGGRRTYKLARGWAVTAAGSRRIGRTPAPPRLVRPLLPVRARIAAGQPLAAGEYADDYDGQTLQDVLALGDDDYLLEVEGHSMVDDGIHPGDYAIIHPQSAGQTRDGDVVVARLGSLGPEQADYTLKRFFRRAGRVRLEPANLHGVDRDGRPYEPLELDAGEVEICGKLVGVVRRVARRHAR